MKAVAQKLFAILLSVVLVHGSVTVGAVETNAETFEPEVVVLLKAQVNVVPDARTAIKDAETYPASFEWQDEAVFESVTELVLGKVVVTYDDLSEDLLDVEIKVVEELNDAVLNEPIGTTELIVTTQGVVPEASQYIVNASVLPADTIYQWIDPTVFDTVGEYLIATIKIVYPDGSFAEMPLTVTVEAPEEETPEVTDAERYTPLVVDSVITDLNVVPDAKQVISNLADLPAASQVAWQDEIIFTEVKMEIFENVIVTYPDGTSDMLPVLVTVREPETPAETDADRYTPTAQVLSTELGVVPQAIDAIANLDELPGATQFAWQDEAIFDTLGEAVNTLILVTYPDQSTEDLEVTVTIVEDLTPEPEAALYTPRSVTLVTTEKGVVPMPKAAIDNLDELPNDATFNWEDETVFNTVAAASFANVIVTYADGSTDTVAIPITVKAAPVATHARVIVHFVDTDGNRLLPSQINAREIGTSFATSRVAIDGYTLDSIVGQEKGIVNTDEGKNTVTYIYRKITPQTQLPNTGELSSNWIYGIGAVALVAGIVSLVLAYRKRQKN